MGAVCALRVEIHKVPSAVATSISPCACAENRRAPLPHTDIFLAVCKDVTCELSPCCSILVEVKHFT